MGDDDSTHSITISLSNGGDHYDSPAEDSNSPFPRRPKPKDAFSYTQTPEIACESCYILLAIILLSLVGSTLFFLYNEPNYQVDSLSISSFNIDVSVSQITASWSIIFSARNPDKVVFNLLDYKEVHVSVFYQDELLSSECIGQLFLSPFHKTKIFSANPVALTKRIDREAAKAIATDWERGIVSFAFRLQSSGPGLDVFCKDVNVAFENSSSTGSMLGQYTACS